MKINNKSYEMGIDYILYMLKGKWKTHILCALSHKPYRYNELLNALNREFDNQLTKKVLTNQLNELVEDCLIKKEILKEKAPQIVVYEITEKGMSVNKVLFQLSKLGEDLARDISDNDIRIKVDDLLCNLINNNTLTEL